MSPEEIQFKEENPEESAAQGDPVSLQRRQNILSYCPKLALREQVCQMAVAVIFTPRLQGGFTTELDRRQMITRTGLIYRRLLDIVLRIDNIDNIDDGSSYIDPDM